jgi:hypothetical protein
MVKKSKKKEEPEVQKPRPVDPVDRLIAEKHRRDDNNCGID